MYKFSLRLRADRNDIFLNAFIISRLAFNIFKENKIAFPHKRTEPAPFVKNPMEFLFQEKIIVIYTF